MTTTTSQSSAASIRKNAQAAAGAAQSASTDCPFCKRVGLPILPLRYAVVPNYVDSADLEHPEAVPSLAPYLKGQSLKGHRYVLRSLRKGYVMVYLGNKLWDAYAVTPTGYLRQLASLDEPDNKADRDITPQCQAKGDNIPASFIHIRPLTQGKARKLPEKIWVAFSDVLWTARTRQRFQGTDSTASKLRAERMQEFSVSGLAQQADTVSHAFQLPPTNPGQITQHLEKRVFEYARDAIAAKKRSHYNAPDPSTAGKTNSVPWESAHGLTLRTGQAKAIAQFAQGLPPVGKQPQLPSAIVLHDPLGMVQELNLSRLKVVEARQNYLSHPKVARPLLISQSIVGLKQMMEMQNAAALEAEEKAKHIPDTYTEVIATGGPVYMAAGAPVTITTTRKERVASRFRPIWKELESHYRERDRAAFEKQCVATLKTFSDWLPNLCADYALWLGKPEWVLRRNDFDTQDPAQLDAQVEHFAAALMGGPTATPQDKDPDPGNAAESEVFKVWEKFTKLRPEDETNPIYLAIFGDQRGILEALAPEGNPFDGEKINKGTKLYKVLKTIIATKHNSETKVGTNSIGMNKYQGPANPIRTAGADAMNTARGGAQKLGEMRVPRAIGAAAQGVAAASGALARLSAKGLATAAEATIVRALQGAVLLFERREVYLATTRMQVGQYLRWLEDLAFEGKQIATRQATKIGKQVVRSVALGSLKRISNETLGNAVIDVTIWLLDKSDEVEAGLGEAASTHASAQVGKAKQLEMAVATAAVHPLSLSPETSAFIEKMNKRLTAAGEQSGALLRGAVSRSLRMTATGTGLIALANMGLQLWSLLDNKKKLEKSFVGNNELRLGFAGAFMGATAGFTEILGVVAKIGTEVKSLMWAARIGATIGAVASFVDAAQAFVAGNRTNSRGDRDATVLYRLAGTAFVVSGVFGTYAAWVGASAFLGPVGIALVLMATGVALAYFALKAEDSVAAIWLDRCYWGKGARFKNAQHPLDRPFSEAEQQEELAQLNGVVLGLKAEVGFNDDGWGLTDFTWDTVKMKLTLPMYNPTTSAYTWQLVITNKHGQLVTVGQGSQGTLPGVVRPSPLVGKALPFQGSVRAANGPILSRSGSQQDILEISLSAEVKASDFDEIKLWVDYVPETGDPSARATILLDEVD